MKPEQKIENLINQIDVTPDEAKSRNTLEAMLQAQAESQPSLQRGTHLSIWSNIMKNRMFKVSAAAVVLLAVLLSLTMIPTQSAYAQIVEGLRNARTLAYTLITTANSQTGETAKTEWLFKDPGLLRTTTGDGYITILSYSQGKQLSLLPLTKQYIIAEFDNLPKNDSPDQFAVIDSLRRLPEKADENLGNARIDGIDVEGYRVFDDDMTTTIWIDPETNEIVQVEQEFPSSPGMNFVMNNIRFDIELDNALFDLTPPDGYTPLGTLKAENQVDEQSLIEFLRLWGMASTNGIYQPISVGPQFSKLVMDLFKEGKLNGEVMGQFDPQVMYKGMLFITQLPPSSNWRYSGENVDVGDSETPIFWYRPADSETYRVIYGDLTVQDVAPEDLPQ